MPDFQVLNCELNVYMIVDWRGDLSAVAANQEVAEVWINNNIELLNRQRREAGTPELEIRVETTQTERLYYSVNTGRLLYRGFETPLFRLPQAISHFSSLQPYQLPMRQQLATIHQQGSRFVAQQRTGIKLPQFTLERTFNDLEIDLNQGYWITSASVDVSFNIRPGHKNLDRMQPDDAAEPIFLDAVINSVTVQDDAGIEQDLSCNWDVHSLKQMTMDHLKNHDMLDDHEWMMAEAFRFSH